MDTMETVRALAQDYVKEYAKIDLTKYKYIERNGAGKVKIHSKGLSDDQTLELAKELNQSSQEFIKFFADSRDKAYVELDIENKYRVSKRVFAMIFDKSTYYADGDPIGVTFETRRKDNAEYWEELLSYCLDMCRIALEAIEDVEVPI